MKNVDIFLQTYNEFDREIKKLLGADDHMPHGKALDRISKKNKLIFKNLRELKTYARLRNCIIHDTVSGIEKPIAEPLPEVTENYVRILNRLKNPLTAYDICTYRSKMLVTNCNQLAIDIMHTMKELLITRVPILEKDRVIGVFNGNTLIYYMINKENPIITNKTVVGDFMEYASLSAQRKEHFEFVKRGITVYEVEELFKSINKDNHKLISLFITSDGTQKGRLLGMVTEWDLFNKVR